MENIICLKLLMTQNWWALSLDRTLYIILRLSVPPNFSENFYTHSVDGLCHQRDFTFESQDSTPMTTVDWIRTEHLTQEKHIYGHVNSLSDLGERDQTKEKKNQQKKRNRAPSWVITAGLAWRWFCFHPSCSLVAQFFLGFSESWTLSQIPSNLS